MTGTRITALRVVVAAACLTAAVVLVPLWSPLVLAAWFADVLGPAVDRLSRALGGRRRGAAAVVVLLALAVLLPLFGMILLLVAEARDLIGEFRAALEGHGSLATALLGRSTSISEPRDWADLLSRYGSDAWRALSAIARTSASVAVAILVFVAGLYTFAADGERGFAWLKSRVPLPPRALDRFAGAFRETGRGLIVAGGGTALVQGLVATVAYVAIGLPRALLLGPLTAVCAIVPFVGTGLVWLPLSIELAATGQLWRAAVVLIVGVGVHALIDNFVRPLLARYGRLSLPTFAVLVSMLGGVALFGAAGALLGPLLVRLAVEALDLLAEAESERSICLETPDAAAGSCAKSVGREAVSSRVSPDRMGPARDDGLPSSVRCARTVAKGGAS